MITEAKPADVAEITSLLNELIGSLDGSQGFDTGKLEENCRLLLGREDSALLLAKESDSTVGVISLNIRCTAASGKTGLIDELIVKKGYRGKGIGRLLLKAAIDKCRQLGCGELEVSTEKTNRKARQFYKKCGLEEDAVLLEMHFI